MFDIMLRKRTAGLNVLAVFLIALIVFNLVFIWYNSAKVSTESNKTSSKIAENIVKKTVKDYNTLPKPEQKKKVQTVNSKIRSLAHFAEFVPLGALALLLLANLFVWGKKKRRHLAVAIVALAFCAICALFDEIHQIFIKGRSFELKDIAIDSSGSLLGILFVMALFYIKSWVYYKRIK